ncbi:hypothetical protein C1I95_12460 [Micromonospora craterilacus]|uniref:Phage tail tape measure protein n=1 Tax=Micromonospora craterilacus TaxID=1655439 RepID=A0A2W2FVW3_9ACTN|nr:hypothetical protein [Micromonospora craterilacus]PZG18984.1 hypothetical protein C1I95_12460 [Micromonospora craterilacus]
MARTITIRFGGDATGVTRAAAQTRAAISGVQSRVGQITRTVGKVVALGVAFGGAASYALAFGAAAGRVTGILAAMPALLVAVIGPVLAFLSITRGLGAAWRETGQQIGGGGGTAVRTGRQVEAAHRQVRAATRALADAQRDAQRAQEAVTRARRDEIERLDDLSRATRGAALDAEEAAIRREDAERDLADAQQMVARAEEQLQRARETGDARIIIRAEEELNDARQRAPELIRRADLALRQAILGVENARDAHEDLAQEQAESARKGVEGSDAVQAALERQAEAQRAAAEAAERLADAQDAVAQASQRAAGGGGIGGGTDALDKLAPSARRVILTLRSLVPAWSAASRAAQNRAWQNVDRDLVRLSGATLPMASKWLLRMGGAWNTAVRQVSAYLSSSRGVADVGAALDGTAGFTERLARAFTPFLSGFMQFAAAGQTFMPAFGGWVQSIAERFEAWAISARESGRMQQWVTQGTAALRTLWQITTNIVGSVRAIFRAADDGGSAFEGFEAGTRAMREWLDSAQGQQAVGDFFERLRDILGSVAQVIPTVVSEGSGLRDTLDVMGVVTAVLADHLDTVAKALPYLAAGLIVVKGAQVAGNVAAAASVPIQVAQTVAQFRLGRAVRLNNALLRGQAAAQTAVDVVQKRSIVTAGLQRAATIAGTVATWGAAAASTALGVAVQIATSPITLIVLAIGLLIAGLILAYKRCDTFRAIVDAAFAGIAKGARWLWDNVLKPWFSLVLAGWKVVGNALLWWWRNVTVPAWRAVAAAAIWLKDRIVAGFNAWRALFARVIGWVLDLRQRAIDQLGRLLNWLGDLGGKLRSRLAPVRDILMAPFKAAFNGISRLWNGTVGKLSFTVPSWVGGPFGGKGFSMPKLPQLAKGGIVRATRGGTLAWVGEGGEDEAVAPLSRLASMIEAAVRTGGGTAPAAPVNLHVEARVFVGDREITDIVRVEVDERTREDRRQLRRRVIAGSGRAR